mgnify:CR=1 FL=1
MATHYIHEFATVADGQNASPDVPNALALFAVGGALYNGLTAAGAKQNLAINTSDLSKTIRLNSQTDSVTTSGDVIGFQSKPRSGAGTSQTMYGAQIGPSISSGIATTGSMIGLHAEVFLRGTAAGAIGGSVRALQLELVTDDAGVRDITGEVNGIRMRMAFSAGTVTGAISAIRIEKAEAQTGSEQWGYVLDLTSVNGLIWDDDFGTEPSTAAGGFKVRINGSDRWVQTYSGAPVS